MFKVFIERPVLATVISILLVILGALALWKLPLQQFPDIAPPAVLVTATYPGANAETLLLGGALAGRVHQRRGEHGVHELDGQ
jgi:HAE1 family hydrophobic/amphiphilic exporter-1